MKPDRAAAEVSEVTPPPSSPEGPGPDGVPGPAPAEGVPAVGASPGEVGPPATGDTGVADPPCAENDLALEVAGSDAALGSRYLLLRATNVTGAACVLRARPDVAFVRASGTVAPDVVLEPRGIGPRKPEPVLLTPGAHALAELHWDAMSTTQDPDVTVGLRVRAVPGARGVPLGVTAPPDPDGGWPAPTSLDVLAGAHVEISPWQAWIDGWGL